MRKHVSEGGSLPGEHPAEHPAGLLTPVHLERCAKVMIWALKMVRRNSGPGMEYSKGDVIILRYDPAAGHLAELVYAELLREGLFVSLKPDAHFRMDKIYYDNAEKDQLEFLGEWHKELARNANGMIVLCAPESLTHLKDCDPKKMALSALTGKPLEDIYEAREQQGLFGWTLCELPTQTLADQAQMTLPEYTQEVVRACYLDDEDPVARWQETMDSMDRVKQTLTDMQIEYLHVFSDDRETDLRVGVGDQRKWLGGSGHNIPSFELFVSPEAGRAEGRFYANEPSFKSGRYVRGVRLEFRNGSVVNVSAEAEEEFVRSRVELDEGSGMIGEFSLTDRRFSKITRFMASTLYDENVGGQNGNCHIAIGSAYKDSYAGDEDPSPELFKRLGFNDSAEHWDLVTTSPRTVVAHLKGGGAVAIYKDGQFTV